MPWAQLQGRHAKGVSACLGHAAPLGMLQILHAWHVLSRPCRPGCPPDCVGQRYRLPRLQHQGGEVAQRRKVMSQAQAALLA